MKKETVKKRRKDILNQAIGIFAKKGFDRTTMDEIALKVKISKPALYLYFKNKEDLFCALIEDRFKDVFLFFDEVLKSDLNSIEKLKRVIFFSVESNKQGKNFFKIVTNTRFKLESTEHTKIKGIIFKNYKKYVEKMAGLMELCIKDGYLKKDDKYFYAFSLIGMTNQNLFGAILYNDDKKLEKLADKIFKQFLEGAGV